MVTIVIIDFQMPVMTGIEAIEEIIAFYKQTNLVAKKKAKIQQISENNRIPKRENKLDLPVFVMFSVHSHKGFIEYAKQRGVDYFI